MRCIWDRVKIEEDKNIYIDRFVAFQYIQYNSIIAYTIKQY